MSRILFLLFTFTLVNYAYAQEATKTAEKGDNLTIKAEIPATDVTFKLALIPGGQFMMGSPEAEASREADEGPQLEVAVDSFYMGIHEVTFDEFIIFREKELDKAPEGRTDWNSDAIARPSPPYEDPTFGMGKEGYPAVSMTQFSALQYCKWLSDKTGDFYRLPTEAEWEYACRAGSQTTYYYGDDTELLDDYAWYYDNSDEKYHKVGSKKPNDWGLYDMLGNVSEWTLDQYQKDAYTTIAEKMANEVNPWIQPTRLHPRTVRGGSWDDDKEDHRCAARIRSSGKWKERDPQIPKSYWWNTDSPFVGFRVVRPYNQPSAEEQAAFWSLVLGD
ncbi:MAG: formylglycine-generating enzyme family protein [Bacteroidota bacterium]